MKRGKECASLLVIIFNLISLAQELVKRQKFFHYTFYLLMRLVSVYTVYTEKQQSEGRVDCVIETNDYIYIFEFKLDGTADAALRQIEEKGYALPYLNDNRRLHRVGVSFSSETGTVDDWKVIE